MNVRRIVVLNIIAFLVVLAALYGGYTYYYQSSHFVSTDDATIQGDIVPLHVEFPGKLSTWNVSIGQSVTSGEVLGTESTSSELQQLGAAAADKQVKSAVSDAAQIKSPITGTLIQSSGEAGQGVAPGETLGEVVDLSKLYIIANINETDIRHVNVGDEVDVHVDAYPNLSLKGTVESVGLAANSFFALIPPSDDASGTYTKVTQTIPVKISLTGYGDANLLPGSSVSVRIHRNTNASA